jgi:hypothetical protein
MGNCPFFMKKLHDPKRMYFLVILSFFLYNYSSLVYNIA